MGSSSSLHLLEVTGFVQGWILTEPIPLSTEWLCWISSGMSPQLCCPSLCQQHCKGSRKYLIQTFVQAQPHMGHVDEYMGIKRKKKATARSLRDYFYWLFNSQRMQKCDS